MDVPRYFWISFCTLSLKFLRAVTASGGGIVGLGMGKTKPWSDESAGPHI